MQVTSDNTFRRAALVLVLFAIVLSLAPDDTLPAVYFLTQDLPALIVGVTALLLVSWRLPAITLPDRSPPVWLVALLAVALALTLWAGTYLVMFDYPLTRDEHMVVFDMGVFAGGRLAQPLAPEWRAFAEALVPAFLLDVPDTPILISNYMPGNAMMRTGFATIADPALMNPVLVGVGLVALNDIAGRLFPENRSAVIVVLAGYLLSAQVLVTAMTTYAMTGHLALNLVWLALFLRGKWWQHALAMLVGMWAIGLHQIVFHPLFAGPVILTLLAQRRWALFAAYAVTYAAALLFWIAHPSLVTSAFGIVAETGSTGGIGAFWAERVVPLLLDSDPAVVSVMAFNLIRFAAWTPIFVVPFVVLAWPAIRANRGLALPLFGGIALTLAAMVILLPYQGHGWGYRYLHGLLGNFALLTGYGYVRWAAHAKKQADGAFAALAGSTALLVLPFLLWSAHNFTRPYVALEALIARQTADFVLVDTQPPSSAVDQVRNRADLGNRPILLSSRGMTADQVAEICGRGTVTLITRADFHRVGFAPDLPEESPEFAQLVRDILGRDCMKPLVAGPA